MSTLVSGCDGEGCPRKDECLRYAVPLANEWHSWFSSPPLCEDGCNYFLPLEEPKP